MNMVLALDLWHASLGDVMQKGSPLEYGPFFIVHLLACNLVDHDLPQDINGVHADEFLVLQLQPAPVR